MNSRTCARWMLASHHNLGVSVTLAVIAALTTLGAADGRFDQIAFQPSGLVRIQGEGPGNRVVQVEGSSNLVTWRALATLIPPDATFEFQDPASCEQPLQFYRFSTSPITDTNDWKNQIALPTDSFANGSEGSDPVRWVKFIILPDEPNRVYYQDSTLYVLHYDFATARLAPFHDMTRAEFDRISLHRTNQQAIVGTVLFPPRTDVSEYAIQFSGLDPYPRDWVASFFDVVRASIVAPASAQPYYFPAYEQTVVALADAQFFASQGIRLGSPLRWVKGDQVYGSGWAFGRLRFVSAKDLDAAYADGRLKPEDILLTEGVPAEIPFVAGIISLAPATPNSHVAILAGAYGVPFVYVADATQQAQLRQLADREIILQGSPRPGYSQVTTVDINGQLDPATRAELLQLKTPPRAVISPKAAYGALSANVEGLMPSDRRYFGGKAANYGILRRLVPDHSTPAIAFSFDLWDAFLDQTLAGGKTLRLTIQERLGSFTNYPPDMAAVKSNLAVVRDVITGQASFGAEQRQAITNALAVFPPGQRIRFRSSSNAEDSKTFAAAGLYDSFSGCLADDLDGDEVGPCRCDPTESRERGVFRAIRKVYASFYNDNAFLERLRYGIDETQVGMALLVHLSSPDEIELANGVAKVQWETQRFGPSLLTATLVTQKGAVSVTNPEGNAQPEIVRVGDSDLLERVQSSSLVPIGDRVLTWEDEYRALFALMRPVYTNYSALAGYPPADQGPLLDFEYKKVQPGKLLLKQVRELPRPSQEETVPLLLSTATTYWVFQQEQSDALANHRLKCRLRLQTVNVRLVESNLTQCFYSDARFEHRRGDVVEVLTGSPATWPGASHSVVQDPLQGTVVRDQWTAGSGADRCTYVLTTAIPKPDALEFPVIVQRDLKKWLEVTYATPVPTLDWEDQPSTTNQEEVQLVASPDFDRLKAGAEETFTAAGRLSVRVAFLVPESGEGPLPSIDLNAWGVFPAYYSSWAHSTLTGLVSEPIVLQGYYATSARAGHKGRYAWYVFEPAMDPDLPPTQRDALEAADIRLIHVLREPWVEKTTVMILGRDGKFRKP